MILSKDIVEVVDLPDFINLTGSCESQVHVDSLKSSSNTPLYDQLSLPCERMRLYPVDVPVLYQSYGPRYAVFTMKRYF